MFCPKCGESEQSPEAFCRGCGTFLPDLTKAISKSIPAEQHLTVNTVLSSMTIVVCFTLSILLWSILAFRPGTHPLIYVTAGLLFAMGIWHIQTLIRTVALRKQIKSMELVREPEIETLRELDAGSFEDYVPSSVVERTTRDLAGTKRKSS